MNKNNSKDSFWPVMCAILTVGFIIITWIAIVKGEAKKNAESKLATLEKQTEAASVSYAFYEDGSGFIEINGFKCVMPAFDSPDDHVTCDNE